MIVSKFEICCMIRDDIESVANFDFSTYINLSGNLFIKCNSPCMLSDSSV